MKKFILILIAGTILLSSCEKDNYDGPTAGLSGRIVDAETGELVQQDIIRGTQIEYIEHGFANPELQYLVIKNDGTYENSLLFANTYTIRPVRGNFVDVAAQDINIGNKTVLDFTVTPYIRVKNVTIERQGSKVVARFKLEQKVINNVKRIGLYAHQDSRVGEPMRQAAAQQDINAVADPNHEYTLELDISNATIFKTGMDFYFRVGALIDVGEAKFNYAPVVKISL